MKFQNLFRSKAKEPAPATPGPAAPELNERLLAAVESAVENSELGADGPFAEDVSAVRKLLDDGANIDCATRDGWTPLLIAVAGDPNLVELLLKLGANPNSASENGYTPLMRAGGQGQVDNVRLLLAAGADPLLRDCNADAAFALTSQAAQFDCAALIAAAHVSALLARRASIVKHADSELVPLPDAARMMVGVTRGVVGGVVRWVSIDFEDGTRLERVRLIDELVMELPREYATRGIKTFSVPQDQR